MLVLRERESQAAESVVCTRTFPMHLGEWFRITHLDCFETQMGLRGDSLFHNNRVS